MIVEGVLLRGAAEEFEAVVAIVPVEDGLNLEASMGLALDRSIGLGRVFELVVEFRAVECVRTEAFDARAEISVYVEFLAGVAALHEGFAVLVVAVELAGLAAEVAVGAASVHRDLPGPAVP